MPDKWEYPWYAAWDLAFHVLPLAMVDPEFAKSQLDLMLRNDYLHPNGQMPAYEWNFGDVNPPVHAHATMQVYLLDKERNGGKGDVAFLTYAFSKLLVNFTWWVNRKDRSGNNVFEGGFLGLDNIGVFDRSSPLPTGGYLEQADGTAWMAFFSQQMLRIAVELALHNPAYEEFVTKFFEHTIWISAAMDRVGENQDDMWDEEDGFFYDVLRFPDGQATRLKVRSMVGLLPLAAVAIFDENILDRLPTFTRNARDFLARHPELSANVHMPATPGVGGRRMISIVNEAKLRRILSRMLDEGEFLGPARDPRALASPPRAPLRLPPRRAGVPGGLRARRLGHRDVRRELQLARTGVDAGEHAALGRRCSGWALTSATGSGWSARPDRARR